MGTNTLTTVVSGALSASWFNQYLTALSNDVVGRNGSGVAESGKRNGTAAIPWGEVHTTQLFLGGKLFDPDNISAAANGVVSGATRSGSGQPDYIRADGSAAQFSVLGATINLALNVNNVGVTVSSDLTLGSLTVAPSSNNTALVNDTTLSGIGTKYQGENGGSIIIDTAGSEITNRVGQYVALKHGSNEIMLAYVESSTSLTNVFRGFFFDSSGNPIVRETIANNDTLTIYSLAWVFLQSDGTTLDVTYTTPVWSYTEPTSPATDDYWFDMTSQTWKRYNGSTFESIERVPIGLVVMDGTNCIASRSFDFSKAFSDKIELELSIDSNTVIKGEEIGSTLSVYGSDVDYGFSFVEWDIATDLESGLTEASDTLYYLYITDDGETKISEERPYNRESDLKGFYHPYHNWRFVGMAYNNGSSNFDAVYSRNDQRPKIEVFESTSTLFVLPNADGVKVTVTGGGGGGESNSGGNGSAGGTTSFGSHCSATGGTGGNGINVSGGSGTGGDLNLRGGGGLDDFGTGGGQGGASFWSQQTGVASTAGTKGAGGAGGTTGGGGGAGGTSVKHIKRGDLKSHETITIGGGGAKGSGTGGGAGGDGIVVVEYI